MFARSARLVAAPVALLALLAGCAATPGPGVGETPVASS